MFNVPMLVQGTLDSGCKLEAAGGSLGVCPSNRKSGFSPPCHQASSEMCLCVTLNSGQLQKC